MARRLGRGCCDELRGRKLYFAFSIPEEAHKRGAITADTPIQFVQHDWDGEPCFFVYTDPAFRIEPLQGCVAIKAGALFTFVEEKNERAGLVINPAGPATCKLEHRTELKSLAQ